MVFFYLENIYQGNMNPEDIFSENIYSGNVYLEEIYLENIYPEAFTRTTDERKWRKPEP